MPEPLAFAAKPELARVMLARALDAGAPVGWVTGDEVYGGSPGLRGWLEAVGMPYVLAVRCTEPLQTATTTEAVVDPPATATAEALAAGVPAERWLTINAADGAKGKRWYAWTRMGLAADAASLPAGWGRWLLVRRNRTPGELAFYRCAGPAGLPLVALVKTAGTRWRVEESFQQAKGLCGLDEHQVRRWTSWYRWVTLAMLAYAFLAVVALTERDQRPPPRA